MNPSAAETKVAKPAKQSAAKGRLDPSLSHASHLAKPQLKFRTPPDNFADGPWRPTLKHKYNAQVPLGYVVDAGEGENAASL
jgi:exosome complex exonuclease RRP6